MPGFVHFSLALHHLLLTLFVAGKALRLSKPSKTNDELMTELFKITGYPEGRP
jgi:hypothetical protein